jgi:hypothetical protein
MRGSELAAGIATWYDELAERRCWILVLRGEAVRLYTTSTRIRMTEFTQQK